jgi:hypothetical protein
MSLIRKTSTRCENPQWIKRKHALSGTRFVVFCNSVDAKSRVYSERDHCLVQKREGHEFTEPVKPSKTCPRFTA